MISEQQFMIGDVPAVRWTPADDNDALILIAHGGGQHKKAPGVVGRAQRFAAAGFPALALDAPNHGDRPRTIDPAVLREQAMTGDQTELGAQGAAEWRTALDALAPAGPVGFFGVALGAAIGLPLVAADPRITAAVLGLTAGPLEAAARIRVPIEFVMQWDDELVPRDAALALFDALGSTDKTLHANPGGHLALPRFEVDSADRFFRRHLIAGS